jgi:hypothetical protein
MNNRLILRITFMVVEVVIFAAYCITWNYLSIPFRIIIFLLICIMEVLFEKHIDILVQWMDNHDKIRENGGQ